MGAVRIKCPNTGEEIDTGIITDEVSFERIPDILMHSHCSLCGLEHSWWKREARLVEPGAVTTRTAA
jgi:hypothetical protein